jgi:hypothetical protein
MCPGDGLGVSLGAEHVLSRWEPLGPVPTLQNNNGTTATERLSKDTAVVFVRCVCM